MLGSKTKFDEKISVIVILLKFHSVTFVKITVIQSNQTYTKCVFDFAGTKTAFD